MVRRLAVVGRARLVRVAGQAAGQCSAGRRGWRQAAPHLGPGWWRWLARWEAAAGWRQAWRAWPGRAAAALPRRYLPWPAAPARLRHPRTLAQREAGQWAGVQSGQCCRQDRMLLLREGHRSQAGERACCCGEARRGAGSGAQGRVCRQAPGAAAHPGARGCAPGWRGRAQLLLPLPLPGRSA
jgi:hypothetical protein